MGDETAAVGDDDKFDRLVREYTGMTINTDKKQVRLAVLSFCLFRLYGFTYFSRFC